MPNIVIPNTLVHSSNEKFHAYWLLTRGLLAAGWRYKASADGNTKETTGDASQDLWSIDGYVNTTTVPGQSGSAASLLTVANGLVTVQGLTGMTASSVGRCLTISGDTDSVDNGNFRIASFISSSSVTIYNPNAFTLAVTNATNASPIVITTSSTASMATGQQVGISGVQGNTAANGIWTITVLSSTTFSLTGSTGNGTYVASTGIIGTDSANGSISWAEKYGGAAASVSSVTNGVATLTGLTGMTASSVGHRITILGAASSGNNGTFMISAYISSSSVQIFNSAAVAGDLNNGSIQWVERDPTKDTYPTALAVGSWIVLQGPSTLKVPIGTNVPSPAFIRGEKVTQAATGTEAEVLGVVTDSTGGAGYMVLAPRVNGSGAGVRGWDQSAITAQSVPAGSGATVTPSAAVIEFVREYVIWKNTATFGHTYYQCIDQASESTPTALVGRFSTMAATLSQCTATVCPGGATGNPTVNGFPTMGTLCAAGTGGPGAATTGSNDYMMQSTVTAGNIQIMCANNIEGSGVSQDGSWTLLLGTPGISASSYNMNQFCRLDDGEDGDVDPYVLFLPSNLSAYTRLRTGGATAHSGSDFVTTAGFAWGTTGSSLIGFRRRGFGFGNGDAFQEFSGYCLNQSNNAQFALGSNFQNPETVACTFASPAPRVREPFFIASAQSGLKMRKGYLRWAFGVSGGNCGDTLDGKKWVQGTSTVAASVSAAVVGPWDGSSYPTQT